MREILFRGKTVIGGDWRQGDLLHTTTGKAPMIRVHSENAAQNVMVDPSAVGQYTGLKDRNGQRIFEGDVVLEHHVYRGIDKYGKKYHVAMDEDRRGWWPFACGDGCGCCEEDTLNPGDCDVIGNIHDNPELMEEITEPKEYEDE